MVGLIVGTLYVVGAPASAPCDITRRALRVLVNVALAVASKVAAARRLFEYHNLSTPLLATGAPEPVLEVLETADVALLLTGWSPAPTGASLHLVQAAIDSGFPVVPLPGPSLPVAALVVSGLPADSFVYLGHVPQEPAGFRQMLARMKGERRTLVAVESVSRLSATLPVLYEVFGDRPVVLVAVAEEMEVAWRGTLSETPGRISTSAKDGLIALVIAGASQVQVRWDETRLSSEIAARLELGLGAKEIGRSLASESGWPRRDIYRWAVELGKLRTDDQL